MGERLLTSPSYNNNFIQYNREIYGLVNDLSELMFKMKNFTKDYLNFWFFVNGQ